MKRGEREDRREAAELNALTEGIIGAAIKVHRELGPGLLEPAYEACLHFELGRQGYSLSPSQEGALPRPGRFVPNPFLERGGTESAVFRAARPYENPPK